MMSERFLWDRFLFRIRVSGMIPEGGTILDVGTGQNTTICEMFGDKWEVTPSDINVGDWNSHIPDIIRLDAESLASKFQLKWDAVVLSELLEHVGNPMGVMQQCYEALKWGGLLVVSTPFLYRIHEFDSVDPETAEPGLKDYWRFTPSGMALLFDRTFFDDYWVGRLVTGDKTTFPEWQCPVGIVAWATKRNIEKDGEMFSHPFQTPENAWNPELPPDWREQQTRMAQKYERRIADAGKQVEPV